MIKCAKCGHENQMGSIFCRGCGEKINMDDLDPAALQNEAAKAKKKGSLVKSLRSMISFVLFLIAAGILAGLFLPIGHGEYVSQSNDTLKAASEKLDSYELKLNMPRTKLPMNVEFTADEINALFEKRFFGKPSTTSADGEKEENEEKAAAGAYSISDIAFSISPEGLMTIKLYTRLAKQIPAVFTLTGTPEITGEGKIGFKVASAKMGHIPMPSFAQKFIVEKYAPLETPHDLKKIFKDASSVDTTDGKVIFKFTKKNSKPKK